MNLQEKWKWKETPFRRDTLQLYDSNKHQEALARLKIIVEEKYLGLFTGEIGSGKTTLIRYLVHQLDAHAYSPVYISIVVIVDEAQDLSEAMLLELRFMNHQMDARSLFPLILVGQPEIRQKLRLKKYEAIGQRIGLMYHLTGLSQEETIAYIRYQMKQAEATVPVFSESAMYLIHKASQGIPRMINHLCIQALYDGAQRENEVIEESHVSRVLADRDRQIGAIG